MKSDFIKKVLKVLDGKLKSTNSMFNFVMSCELRMKKVSIILCFLFDNPISTK